MLAWVLIIFLLFTGIFLTFSWIMQRQKCTAEVKAAVISIEYTKGSVFRKESRHYYPVYRFIYDQREFEVRPSEPERTSTRTVGFEETLWIDPGNPDHFRRKGDWSDLIYGIVSLFIGILILIAHLFTV